MLEGGIIFAPVAPLNSETPTLAVDFLSNNVSSPSAVVPGLAITPYV